MLPHLYFVEQVVADRQQRWRNEADHRLIKVASALSPQRRWALPHLRLIRRLQQRLRIRVGGRAPDMVNLTSSGYGSAIRTEQSRLLPSGGDRSAGPGVSIGRIEPPGHVQPPTSPVPRHWPSTVGGDGDAMR
jgi:hypothetical protein